MFIRLLLVGPKDKDQQDMELAFVIVNMFDYLLYYLQHYTSFFIL